MDIAQKITSMVLALRRKVNIKVRQPLQQIMIPAIDQEQKAHIEAVKDLILNEVNVKELKFAEGQGILVKKVKCNFRVMGKKYGKQMKAVAAKMESLTQEEITAFEKQGTISFHVNDDLISVVIDDVDIISEDIPGWLVSNDGNITVALEVELTSELRKEGLARELITGLDITDRIIVTVSPYADMDDAVKDFSDYIMSQVLADNIIIANNNGSEIEFDNFNLNIQIKKV